MPAHSPRLGAGLPGAAGARYYSRRGGTSRDGALAPRSTANVNRSTGGNTESSWRPATWGGSRGYRCTWPGRWRFEIVLVENSARLAVARQLRSTQRAGAARHVRSSRGVGLMRVPDGTAIVGDGETWGRHEIRGRLLRAPQSASVKHADSTVRRLGKSESSPRETWVSAARARQSASCLPDALGWRGLA